MDISLLSSSVNVNQPQTPNKFSHAGTFIPHFVVRALGVESGGTGYSLSRGDLCMRRSCSGDSKLGRVWGVIQPHRVNGIQESSADINRAAI